MPRCSQTLLFKARKSSKQWGWFVQRLLVLMGWLQGLAVGEPGCAEGQLPCPALQPSPLPSHREEPQSLWVQDAAAQSHLWRLTQWQKSRRTRNLHFAHEQGHQGQNSPLLASVGNSISCPTTTPYSQAGFLLPPITSMRHVHTHRSASRSVTQEIRNVSPGMTAGRRLGAAAALPGWCVQ